MKIMKLMLLSVMMFVAPAMADDGLVRVQSNHDVATTVDKLEQALTAKGMKVFGRINHTQGAENAGMELRPTELVIFGNPKVGTPLMICSQTTAIDLPQKMLVFEDANGVVWLAYNNLAYLNQRHGLSDCQAVMEKVNGALANFAKAATE